MVVALVTVFNGGGAAIWSQSAIAILGFTIFVVAFKNGGSREIRIGDLVCLSSAMLALLCWLVAKQPALAVTFIALSTVFSAIPTLRKSWSRPHEEAVPIWMIQTASYTFVICAVSQLSYTTVISPVANIIVNMSIAIIVLYRRRGKNSDGRSSAAEEADAPDGTYSGLLFLPLDDGEFAAVLDEVVAERRSRICSRPDVQFDD